MGAKYSKWIVILQDFDLEIIKSKFQNSLVFNELICNLPSSKTEFTSDNCIPDKSLSLIDSFDP